ncbi:MAG TPA: helix-turn-helix transcriptional regulator [Candidatus Faecivivens stercorigallinarum]|nr:helix-turn-helix transcriptional regulator [Candidatus Faecivivens stercorigallinarum]
MYQNKAVSETADRQNEKWLGVWIRQNRLQKNWSQDGLCKGICAVSYLSKIEQGKVIPTPEILYALAAKLNGSWETDPDVLTRYRSLIDAQYQYIFTLNANDYSQSYADFEQYRAAIAASPFLLDCLLLEIWLDDRPKAELDGLRCYLGAMSSRQHQLYLMLTDSQASVQLYPSAHTCYWAGIGEYEAGHYTHAVELLTRAYSLASEDGELYLQTSCRIFIGNCYANMLDVEQMQRHYHAARKMSKALGQYSELSSIDYNLASTELEIGDFTTAYQYFSNLSNPSALDLHKLAICCEKLGNRQAALDALEQVHTTDYNFPEKEIMDKMCELVRFRLTHPDYLSDTGYGELLLDTFAEIRQNLPAGYAAFHLPWVLEWYREHRLYKDAFQLLMNFPEYSRYNTV